MELEVVNSTSQTNEEVLNFPKKESVKNTEWENSTNTLGISTDSLKQYSKNGKIVELCFLFI